MHYKPNLYIDNGAQVQSVYNFNYKVTQFCGIPVPAALLSLSQHEIRYVLTLILWRSRTGTVWFYTSTSNKRAAQPKLYTKSLTRDLKRMYSHLTLVRISINLWALCVLYIGTGVSLLFRERFLYI